MPTEQSAENPGTRPRRRVFFYFLVVALGLLALKVALSYQFSGPWFEPDESTYALRGYHLATGDGLSWRHPWRAPGKEGYPAFLGVVWLLANGDTDTFLRLALLGNCLISLAITLVAYAVLRRWFGPWAALGGAVAITLYAPVFFYGFALLSEELFFLVVLVTVWLTQRVAQTAKWYWWVLLGAAAAVSYSVRVSGIATLAAVAMVVVVAVIGSLATGRRWRSATGLLAIAAMVALLLFFQQVTRPAVTTTPVVSQPSPAVSGPAGRSGVERPPPRITRSSTSSGAASWPSCFFLWRDSGD